MDQKEQLEQFINAIGAIGDIAGILYKSLMSNGFSRVEAMDITKTMLIEFLNMMKK